MQLIDFTDQSMAFRSWLLNDGGEALLYFDRTHLQEVRADWSDVKEAGDILLGEVEVLAEVVRDVQLGVEMPQVFGVSTTQPGDSKRSAARVP